MQPSNEQATKGGGIVCFEEASTRPQTVRSVKHCYRHKVALQILLKRLPIPLKRSSKSPALLQTQSGASNPIEAPPNPVEALLKIPQPGESKKAFFCDGNNRRVAAACPGFPPCPRHAVWLPPAGLAFLLVQDTRCWPSCAVFGATAPTAKRLSAERKVSSYLPSTGFLDKFQSGHKAGAKSVCRGIV